MTKSYQNQTINTELKSEYQSPYSQERKAEMESMELIRILKDIWETLIGINNETYLNENEATIRSVLKADYDVHFVHFDRVNKLISFEFEMEEIIL